jgi:O-antigen ligase
MNEEPIALRAAKWLTFGSAVSVLFSIAVSQILLALALASLLISGEKLRLPRIWLPLGLFLLGTLISLAFSDDPRAGLPQVRKFYVFCELLVVFSCLRSMRMIRWLFLTWAFVASITAVRGCIQFAGKVQEARHLGQDFYTYYVGERITGFMSHWNTYSAQEMFALLMIGSFLFFAANVRKRALVWIGCAVLIALAVLLGETRGIWIGAATAGVYLVWFWQRKLVLAVPALIVAAFFLSPPAIRARFTSLLRPSQSDSNSFRIVTWRTGIEMIKAHPVLGLGPEEVRIRFDEYIPADVPRPLPAGWYGHLHNIYLHYAAERGIPTMLALMWLLCQILYDFWQGIRRSESGRSDRKFVLHGGIAVVLATMVAGIFELNLGDTEVLTMFLVVVACGYLALDAEIGAKPVTLRREPGSAA